MLHEIVHLRRRIDDAVELPDALDVPESACLAVRLYDSDAGLLAVVVPARTVPATTAVARAARTFGVRPADPARVCAVTEYHPTLVPPLGLPAGVRAVAEASLRDEEVVYTATGDGGTALKIRADDLLAVTGASLARLVEPGAEVFDRVAENGWREDPFGGRVPLRF